MIFNSLRISLFTSVLEDEENQDFKKSCYLTKTQSSLTFIRNQGNDFLLFYMDSLHFCLHPPVSFLLGVPLPSQWWCSPPCWAGLFRNPGAHENPTPCLHGSRVFELSGPCGQVGHVASTGQRLAVGVMFVTDISAFNCWCYESLELSLLSRARSASVLEDSGFLLQLESLSWAESFSDILWSTCTMSQKKKNYYFKT